MRILALISLAVTACTTPPPSAKPGPATPAASTGAVPDASTPASTGASTGAVPAVSSSAAPRASATPSAGGAPILQESGLLGLDPQRTPDAASLARVFPGAAIVAVSVPTEGKPFRRFTVKRDARTVVIVEACSDASAICILDVLDPGLSGPGVGRVGESLGKALGAAVPVCARGSEEEYEILFCRIEGSKLRYGVAASVLPAQWVNEDPLPTAAVRAAKVQRVRWSR